MVRILAAALLITAVSASASPAIPSFEFSAAQLQSSIAALRASQVKTKAGSIEPQIRNAAWDLENAERETSRLRTDLTFLLMRVRRYQPPTNGRPGNDPSLRWDVQRFSQALALLTRDSQWRANDLRFLTSQAEKDETLVAAASSLADAAHRFKDATNWLLLDAGLAYFDFMRAGFAFEAADLDRNSRDVDGHARDIQHEGDRLLSKVRG